MKDRKIDGDEIVFYQKEATSKWSWIRKLIICTLVVIIFTQSLAPFCFESDEDSLVYIEKSSTKRPYVVLHTGFPPIENITGLPIEVNKAAAIAFSPNPSKDKRLNAKYVSKIGDETWWDRLFPNRHVHLQAIQVPVLNQITQPEPFKASISICASSVNPLEPYGSQFPNLNRCMMSPIVQSESDEDTAFGLLEWVPESPIVLKKASVYWLVIQTQSISFKWVYSETNGDSTNELGVAIETESGWAQLHEGDPIPSAMILVQDHN